MPHSIARPGRAATAGGLLRGTAIVVALAAGMGAAPTGAASLSGSYLAAMQADYRNDYAAAAEYMTRALLSEPENPGLLQNGLVAQIAAGRIDLGIALADRLAAVAPGHQLASIVLVADAFAREDFAAARQLLETGGTGLSPLLAGLLTGWAEVGLENFAGAQAAFDAMDDNEALQVYGQYHKALALAVAGDFPGAATILAGGENGPLHVNLGAVLARAQILAQIDREDEALAILDQTLATGLPNAVLLDLRERIGAGEAVAFDQVVGARNGAAEAFLVLADALDTDETGRLALLHARLAAHVDPADVEARVLVADTLEAQEQFALAAAALEGVDPASPWFVTTEIRRANTQSAAGDPEGGLATLEALRYAYPEQVEVHSALGDALRVAERFEEAAAAYDGAIERIGTPQPAHWVLFYTRGIANERSGDWDGAEADFRRALELEPDQPLVLNYLGYSLVEKRRNLDEALAMIEAAVAGQPDDGYITDSLGWVLYRLGRFNEALPHMLRAVELTPDDPVVNDHLGDVLWKVGRTREAEFQWRRALSFGPADDLDMDRIRRKLEVGLDTVLASETADTDG